MSCTYFPSVTPSSNPYFFFCFVLLIGWLLVSFFTLMVGLSLAEICSAFPTSGGLYVWTTRLCSAAWAPIASWTVGYTNWLGLVRLSRQQHKKSKSKHVERNCGNSCCCFYGLSSYSSCSSTTTTISTSFLAFLFSLDDIFFLLSFSPPLSVCLSASLCCLPISCFFFVSLAFDEECNTHVLLVKLCIHRRATEKRNC